MLLALVAVSLTVALTFAGPAPAGEAPVRAAYRGDVASGQGLSSHVNVGVRLPRLLAPPTVNLPDPSLGSAPVTPPAAPQPPTDPLPGGQNPPPGSGEPDPGSGDPTTGDPGTDPTDPGTDPGDDGSGSVGGSGTTRPPAGSGSTGSGSTPTTATPAATAVNPAAGTAPAASAPAAAPATGKTPTAKSGDVPMKVGRARTVGADLRASRERARARRLSAAPSVAGAQLITAADLTAGIAATSPVPATAQAQPAARGARSDEGRVRKEGSGSSTPDPGSAVTRTVQQIVEVVPTPVKVALGGLIALALLLAGGYLFNLVRARRLARQRADLLSEVGLLQTALLPPVPAQVGSVLTSVAYRPAAGIAAGGDFYDALTLSGGRSAFILGDVCGHGRDALERTAFIRYTLRAYLEAGLGPRMALQVAGRVIDEHMGGKFATVVIAIHDPLDGSLTYASAGHPSPIVVGPTRPEPVSAASSPPVGLGLRTGLRQTTVPLPPGSVVCLYTDGLAEAKTEDGGILGRPRLADIVAEQGRDATASGLLAAIADEASEVNDDMATVLMSPSTGVTTGAFRTEQLEVDSAEAEAGLAERFLTACDVTGDTLRTAAAEIRTIAAEHGAAVVHVRFGVGPTKVDVLPRTAEVIEVSGTLSASA